MKLFGLDVCTPYYHGVQQSLTPLPYAVVASITVPAESHHLAKIADVVNSPARRRSNLLCPCSRFAGDNYVDILAEDLVAPPGVRLSNW